jgi:hypothetical protein
VVVVLRLPSDDGVVLMRVAKSVMPDLAVPLQDEVGISSNTVALLLICAPELMRNIILSSVLSIRNQILCQECLPAMVHLGSRHSTLKLHLVRI